MDALDRQTAHPQATLLRELTVEKLVYRGYGLAHHNRQTVFVQHAAPGDIVDAEVVHRRGDVLLARVKDLCVASPERVPVQCPVFGKCGGCDWLMLPYESQLKWKQRIVAETVRSLGCDEATVAPVVPSPQPCHYRNKSYLPIAPGPTIGMYAPRSHQVIEHERCLLQPALFDELAEEVRAWMIAAKIPVYDPATGMGTLRYLGIRHSPSENRAVLALVTKGRRLPFTRQLARCLERFPLYGAVQNVNPHPGNVILGEDDKLLWGSPAIVEKVGHCSFHASYRSFFQVNSGQAENLYRFAESQIESGDTVADAFCGVGSFGIYLARKAGRVIGIEINPAAIRDARENALRNNAGNCEFLEGAVETLLPALLRSTKVDTLLIDPPRKGLEATTIPALSGVRKIIYISCNPSTQVRDVRALRDIGFGIRQIQPFDMFPQTYHIENVIVLERAL